VRSSSITVLSQYSEMECCMGGAAFYFFPALRDFLRFSGCEKISFPSGDQIVTENTGRAKYHPIADREETVK